MVDRTSYASADMEFIEQITQVERNTLLDVRYLDCIQPVEGLPPPGPMTLMVMRIIALYAPSERPSIATIAQHCGCSTRTLRRHLLILERNEVLRRVRRRGEDGASLPNRYVLNFEMLRRRLAQRFRGG